MPPTSASPLFALLRAEHDTAVFRAPLPADSDKPVMTSDSSFIVLESERDDRAVLAADQATGKGDKLFSMDEPDPFVWVFIAGAVLALAAAARTLMRKRRKNYG